MKLSGNCRKQLEEAENKVELLVKRAGKIVPEPFAAGEEPPA
jgi:exonuclease VII small subunit